MERLPEFQFLLPRHPWLKGLDRLVVLSDRVARATSSAELSADAALARLSQAGLACRRAAGELLHILGGTSAFEASGIRGFERHFVILKQPEGGFIASITGTRSFPGEEVEVATLAQAVDAVLGVYRTRGMLTAETGR